MRLASGQCAKSVLGWQGLPGTTELGSKTVNVRNIIKSGYAFAHDLIMIVIAWGGAYWLRFDLSEIPVSHLETALLALPILVLVQGGVFWYFGLYKGLWQFSSMPDLTRIVKAVIVGVALSVAVLFLLTRLNDIPRSAFPIYFILLLIFLGGPRFLYRWIREYPRRGRSSKRVLVVGAGQVGEMLVRDLNRDGSKEFHTVAFADDSKDIQGKEIHGVGVAGTCDEISEICERLGIELIIIAIPSASPKQTRRIVSLCEASALPVRTIPRMADFVSGKSILRELREVKIEDLLGREPVSLNYHSVRSRLSEKSIMVTGGGGSIGSELCRQIAAFQPNSLSVMDNSEYNLYSIGMELNRRFPELTLHSLLIDVTDPAAVDAVMGKFKPHAVFHAAAYKHVPILESQTREAIRNNVIGTRITAQAAVRNNVEVFVLISTDKAVNPSSMMGASKRVAEIYCQNQPRQLETRFVTVRFGNVLDSAGSVVPLFREQIATGGPVTVTHAEMERYFMTIPEASQLILQAEAIGKGGEIFALDMGEPVKIRYLAEQMIRLAGKTPNEDIEIVYTGLRPGEKLFEELFHEQEAYTATAHEKIFLARKRPMRLAHLESIIDRIGEKVQEYDEESLKGLVLQLVPEYSGAQADEKDNVVAMPVTR